MRLMSENCRLEKLTPTSGPGPEFWTPGGKFCWTMKPAVRDVKAFSSLLKNEAVPALAMALARIAVGGTVPFTLQTPSTKPSRSTTAITLLGEIWDARVGAWAVT